MKHHAIAFLLASTATAAFAQDLTHKAPPQRGPIALTNAAIYPVSAEPIADGWILFEAGRITGLGAGDPASLPQGTTVIDLKNQKRS